VTAPRQIRIEAIVEPQERPALLAGAEQLSDALTRAAGQASPWPVSLIFRPAGSAVPASPETGVAIVSLASEAGRTGEPIAATRARWTAYLEMLQASGAPVCLSTVFRVVPDRPVDGRPSPLAERICRLNRMAADLSHDLGVTVIDIDRAMAHVGGRVMGADWRLGGVFAAEVAGHAVAWGLLALGLDDLIEPALQDRARRALGGLHEIDDVVARRLAQRRVS
jgi:hypothetical protein